MQTWIRRVLRVAVVAAMLVPAVSFGAKGPVVLVIPAHYRVVQLAFDLATMRECVLVSYQGAGNAPAPALHTWQTGQWKPLGVRDYAAGAFLPGKPRQVIVVGAKENLPQVLVEAAAWGPLMRQIPTVDIAALVNALAEYLPLKRAEIEWLAKRYSLGVVERNAPRR